MEKIKANATKVDFQKIFPFLGLAAVLIFFGIFSGGRLFTAQNMKAILNDGLYIIVGATGYAFLFAMGILDFSIGANMAVSCAVACYAAKVNPWLALPAALLTGMLISGILGLVHVKAHVDAFITTLAGQFILNGLVLIVLDNSTQQAPLAMLKWFTLPLKLVILIGCLVAGYMMLEHGVYGKTGKLIGSCPEAARQTGINVGRYKLAAFITMGGLVGLLGFVSLIRTGTASSKTGSTLMMNVLNAALLGGLPMSGGPTTKYRGVVVGSLTMAFLTSGMTIMGYNINTQQIVKGLIFLIAISISFDRKNMKVIK